MRILYVVACVLMAVIMQAQDMKVYHSWIEVFNDDGMQLPDSIVTLRQVDAAAYHFDFEKANSKQWKAARKNAVAIKRDSALWVMSDFLIGKCGAKQFAKGDCLLATLTPKVVYFVDWDKRVSNAKKRMLAIGLGGGLGGIVGAVAATALEQKPHINNQECCFSMIDPADEKVVVINPKNFKKLCKPYPDLLAEFEALDKETQKADVSKFFMRYVDCVNADLAVRPFVEFYKMRAAADKAQHRVRKVKDDDESDLD